MLRCSKFLLWIAVVFCVAVPTANASQLVESRIETKLLSNQLCVFADLCVLARGPVNAQARTP